MALSKSFRVLVCVVVATASLVSCAKKDSEFKGRKNAAGAGYVGDQDKNLRADQAATALGISMLDITEIRDPVSNGQGGLAVTSKVAVNQNLFEVTTNHYNTTSDATAQHNLGDLQMYVNARCTTTNCNPYYIMVNFRRGQQDVKQMVLKKFFFYGGEATQMDYILARGPGEFVDMNTAMGILDQAIVPTDE